MAGAAMAIGCAAKGDVKGTVWWGVQAAASANPVTAPIGAAMGIWSALNDNLLHWGT